MKKVLYLVLLFVSRAIFSNTPKSAVINYESEASSVCSTPKAQLNPPKPAKTSKELDCPAKATLMNPRQIDKLRAAGITHDDDEMIEGYYVRLKRKADAKKLKKGQKTGKTKK